jgi:hypothetical protein
VRTWFSGFSAALMLRALLSISFAFAAPGLSWGGNDRIPEPAPPTLERDVPATPSSATVLRWGAPSALTEWTYHKTGDNLHPDGNEQQLVWLMNRARANPTQEGVWLATENDPDIAGARTYWGVDVTVLQNDFAAIPAKPPAAFDVRLYTAAKAHSDYLISIDDQNHIGQVQRVDAAGFKWQTWAGIVYAYSEHTVYGHAGFNIDWGGSGPTGMQDPPGHRNAIMSVNADYTNVGYAVVAEANPSTAVGPQVITGNLCHANAGAPDHYNRFLVGTVWVDSNGNDQYDPGEGIGGVRVEPDLGDFFAVTADSGGYAIPVTAAGNYTVTFSGSTVTTAVTRAVTVGSTSVLLDLKYASGSFAAAANTGLAAPVYATSAVLNGSISPDGLTTTYYFEYGTSTAYGLTTASRTTDADASVSETIGSLSALTTYHYRMVAANSAGTSYGPDRFFQTAAADPASGGGGGGGCLLTAAATGMNPGSLTGLVCAIGVTAALLALRSRRRARSVSIPARGSGSSTDKRSSSSHRNFR